MSLSFALAASVISFATPLAERQRILAPMFAPAPGESLTVTPRAMALTRTADSLLTKGELWVKPPPGTCLYIRSDLKRRDQKFCRDSPYIWDLFDIDPAGQVKLTVISGPKDEGTRLVWPTPYRLASVVPIESEQEGDNYNLPILSCEASVEQDMRKIVLTLMNGRKWFIYLPDFDVPVSDNKPPPNLIVRIDSKKTAKADETEPTAGKEDDAPKKRSSALSQLLSGAYKSIKKDGSGFHVSKRNSYEMSSSHFMESSVPQGMTGLCRYKFEGAPGDPSSGVIECFSTDSLATVYTHVTCFSQFSPRLAAAGSKKPPAKEERAKGAKP